MILQASHNQVCFLVCLVRLKSFQGIFERIEYERACTSSTCLDGVNRSNEGRVIVVICLYISIWDRRIEQFKLISCFSSTCLIFWTSFLADTIDLASSLDVQVLQIDTLALIIEQSMTIFIPGYHLHFDKWLLHICARRWSCLAKSRRTNSRTLWFFLLICWVHLWVSW